ncbi:nitrous oxide-stimulated promoter family protein [Geotalea sp. SG265]|uniref:nitrous oxide-stimulated promoter family protein n=1 Tax=Geotalea sp. SG265 TaxID=2922867 RepID=UPI001FAFB537|nr:nitrous oxide-stimulated promoter family protein [Geotalea sp. SG265]
MKQFTEKQKKDLKVLVTFVDIYCRARHGEKRNGPGLTPLPAEPGLIFKKDIHLCGECASLVAHALDKRRRCPLDPKPSCKKCPIHCYSKEYRARIREVMAFSGRRMIMRGRLDLLWHYLF